MLQSRGEGAYSTRVGERKKKWYCIEDKWGEGKGDKYKCLRGRKSLEVVIKGG